MQYETAAQMAPGIVQQKPQAFGVGACGLFLGGRHDAARQFEMRAGFRRRIPQRFKLGILAHV
jgi:hypothetical protein